MTDDQTRDATTEQAEAERSDEELSSEELENVAGGGDKGMPGTGPGSDGYHSDPGYDE